MCFCCCTTRKSILIYTFVISSFAFIYGIIAIANFGSSTDIYKALIEKLDYLEKQPSSSSSSSYRSLQYYNDPYYYGYDANKYAKTLGNSITFMNIKSLKKEDIQNKNYGLIKNLKGIECGLGVILFLFPLIFLVVEIVFLIFIRGNKEFQVLPNSTFNIFNIIHILCITFSTIFIFLSVLYGILLVVAYMQYIFLVLSVDSCAIGIVIGMVFGYYGFWYYIILSCAFCSIRTKFLNVGCEEKPGAEAQYDINGNIIPRNPQIVQQIIIPGQIQANPQGVPIQQSQQYIQYQQPQQYVQYQQLQQPQQFVQYQQLQQPQQFVQYQQPQQPQTVEVKNNEKVGGTGITNRKINNANVMSSERDNKLIQK